MIAPEHFKLVMNSIVWAFRHAGNRPRPSHRLHRVHDYQFTCTCGAAAACNAVVQRSAFA